MFIYEGPTVGLETRPVRTLMTILAITMFALPASAANVPPGTVDEIRDRLQPHGSLCIEGNTCGAATSSAPTGTGLSGSDIYGTYCVACHSTGVSGAPKLGDAGDWEARVAKGRDTLLTSTVDGLGVLMPARGTCMSCTDEELDSALAHMLDSL